MKKILVLGLCCGVTAVAFAASNTASLPSSPKATTVAQGQSMVVQPTHNQTLTQATKASQGLNDREAYQTYVDLKFRGAEIPGWLTQQVFGTQPVGDARQGGDTPASATAIPSLPYSDTGTTVGYVNDVTNFSGPDVFYSMTLGAFTDVTASLCGSAFDTGLEIYVNAGGSLGALMASNDDFCGLQSQVTVGLAAGNYYIVVDGWGGNSGAYTLAVDGSGGTNPCDEFSNTVITLPYTGTGTNVGAPDVLGTDSGDVGYTFTLTQESAVTFTSCLPGTDYDSDSYLYLGDPCDGGTQLYYNDGGGCSPVYWASNWFLDCGNLTAGTYTLVLSGYSTLEGNYEFSISATPCSCPPINCTGTAEAEPNDGPNADPIVFGEISCGETVCGTVSASGGSRDTDWYELLLLNDAIVTVDLNVEAFNGVIYFLAGDASTIMYGADVAGFCADETLTTDCLQAGTYYVFASCNVFDGLASANYGLTVSCENCTYVSPCDGAPQVVCGGSYVGDTTGDLNYVGNAAPDNFFVFNNAVPNNIVTFSLCGGSTWDTYLRVYDRCPTDAGAVQLFANDDFCGLQSELTAILPVATYYVVVEGYSSASGAYTMNVTCATCDPLVCDGTAEVEPNDGPNADPIVFGSIACDETVCGTTFTDDVTGSRDTDWYEVVLTHDGILTAFLDVESFNGVLYLLDGTASTILASADAAGFCADEVMVSECLQAGTYYVFVAHNAFSGVPIPANYGLSLSCENCTWVDPYVTCQTIIGPDGAWNFGTSEVDIAGGTNYMRAERFGGVVGAITAVDFEGIDLSYNAGWTECDEEPMPFNVIFYDLAMTPVASYTPTLAGTLTNLYAGVYQAKTFHFDLPAPLAMTTGYIGIQGSGSITCSFLWGAATGADAQSMLSTNGGAWAEGGVGDLNYCLTVVNACDPVTNLTIAMAFGSANLAWSAPAGADSYDVYGATNGYGTYTLLGNTASTSFVDAGAQAAGRKFYKVVAVCN